MTLYLYTPINVHALTDALKCHPGRKFGNYLIQGFKNEFHPGLLVTPDSSYTCHNLQSATSQPDIVDKLLDQKIKDRFMISTFPNPPFSPFRISPIGIATRKYSGKKRVIIDLSSPHSSPGPKHQQPNPLPRLFHALRNNRSRHLPHQYSRPRSFVG